MGGEIIGAFVLVILFVLLFSFLYLYSSLQTELIDEQFFEFVVDIFSL